MTKKNILLKKFLEMLKQAGKEMIDENCFKLEIAGSDNSKQFERSYCYELYHHLKSLMKDVFPLKLHPEINKANHPIISVSVGKVIPDFIIHEPNEMDQNLIVIEVKPYRNGNIKGMEEDVEKLNGFIKNAGYYRGIMYIFSNENLREPPDRIKSEMMYLRRNVGNKLLFVWHGGPGLEPNIVTFD